MPPLLRKIFLIVPPTGLYIREDRCQTPIGHMTTIALRPPIDLLYAAAAFEAEGAECKVTDYPGEGWGLDRLMADLEKEQPDLVLFSITTPGFSEDMAVAREIKARFPKILLAAKGAHFNSLDERALQENPQMDLVFRGEMEEACRELTEGKPWQNVAGITWRDPETGAVHRNLDRPFIQNLDRLHFPARHLAHNALYLRPDTGEMQTTLVTNRGCPFSCVYCLANQVAGRKNRARSVENILDEIQECVEHHGIRNFLFRSDLFTANKKWTLELCAAIRQRGLDIAWSCNSRVDTIDAELLEAMKQAGCWIIAYGVESGSQEMLDHIGKRTDLAAAEKALGLTRKAGILSSIYLLLGLPWENRETIEANRRFARKAPADVLEVFYVYPFPGTTLYQVACEAGLLQDGEIPKTAYDGPCMNTLHLKKEEIAEARNWILKAFYLRPTVILRTLLRARSFRELGNYLHYGLRQLREFF